MILSGHTTGKDELHRLTVGKRAVLNSTLSDAVRFVSLEDLATKQLQVRRVLPRVAAGVCVVAGVITSVVETSALGLSKG